jgi:PHD/YefM family antitoxin component YafN of YafNO toxin-antitoxin module
MVDSIVIRDGKVIMDKEYFEELVSKIESVMETLEILADSELVEQIKESEKDIEAGRVFKVESIDDLKAMILE